MAEEIVASIRSGYDNVRFYEIVKTGQLVRSGWIHDNDFAVIIRIARSGAGIKVLCNGVDITDAL